MRISVFVVAAAMLVSAPAFAQVEALPSPQAAGPRAVTQQETVPAAGQTSDATEPSVEVERVCRNVTARTESRLRSRRERVCKTQAEWDAQEAAESRSN